MSIRRDARTFSYFEVVAALIRVKPKVMHVLDKAMYEEAIRKMQEIAEEADTGTFCIREPQEDD